jgi:hypothetical protein
MDIHRRAMLDPRFADLYPELPPGQWVDAWDAARQCAERLWFERGASALYAGRVLSDEHFQFQGGKRRVRSGALERMGDQTAAQ